MSSVATPESPLMTTADVAAYLKCVPLTVRSLVRAGEIPKPRKIGRRLLWRRVDIEAHFSGPPDTSA